MCGASLTDAAGIGLIDRLAEKRVLSHEEWTALISSRDKTLEEHAADLARAIATEQFGDQVFFRGIVEFSNHCRNDCLYCGIRRSNQEVGRYRLDRETILACCRYGYDLGFRTFVLQSGEDLYFTDDRMCAIVSAIREEFGDCAITLSLGERDHESYQRLFDAGADRYLLRHETASDDLYRRWHPAEMSLSHRMDCLYDLKSIGYATGCGMMVGAPFQTASDLAMDMEFMADFKPEMVGMGPFIPHHATPFRNFPAGDLDECLYLLSLIRIMLPGVLLPATTALGTIDVHGREKGVLAGANVIMPNLSPGDVREEYLLYDGKICTGDTASTCMNCLDRRLEETGYRMVVGRGDPPKWSKGGSAEKIDVPDDKTTEASGRH